MLCFDYFAFTQNTNFRLVLPQITNNLSKLLCMKTQSGSVFTSCFENALFSVPVLLAEYGIKWIGVEKLIFLTFEALNAPDTSHELCFPFFMWRV